MTQATIQQIIDAVGGKPSRDGHSVVLSYGTIGYLRLIPATVWAAGTTDEIPAVRIDGKLSRGNGGTQADLRAKLRAAGLEIA